MDSLVALFGGSQKGNEWAHYLNCLSLKILPLNPLRLVKAYLIALKNKTIRFQKALKEYFVAFLQHFPLLPLKVQINNAKR